MPLMKVELDPETYARLAGQAVAERRPIVWQAEVALRRALGLPFPIQVGPGGDDDPPAPQTAAQ
jgi:hypothetical protein